MKKIAICIGNAKYKYQKSLRNSINDATDISHVLKELDFEVKTFYDLSHLEMENEILLFQKCFDEKIVTFLFFAGHGVEINGINYLVPTDFNSNNSNNHHINLYSMEKYFSNILPIRNAINIVVLDACRNNPFENSRDINSGFRPFANPPKGCFIAYSTSPNETAHDGYGHNGLFTGELLKNIRNEDQKIEDTFKYVRNKVEEISNGKQITWDHSSLTGDFYFNPLKNMTDEEIYKLIENEANHLKNSTILSIKQKECLPYLNVQKKVNLSLLEIMRSYFKVSHSNLGQEFDDEILDAMNIRYVEAWGFTNKYHRWFFEEKQVWMGEPLPIKEIETIHLPEVGKELNVQFLCTGSIVENSCFFTLETNLPDKFTLIATFYTKNQNYSAQSKSKVQNGTCVFDGFTSLGEECKEGVYYLEISTPVNDLQSKAIKVVLGKNGKNLIGENILEDVLLGKRINSIFIVDKSNGKLNIIQT